MKKRKLAVIAGSAVIAAGVMIGCSCYFFAEEPVEVITKETTVERGNIVTGITESGSIAIESLTQDFEVDLTASVSSSENTLSDSSSGSGSDSQGSGMAAGGMGNMGGMEASTGTSTASGTTTSSSDTAELIVEEVYIAEGQFVQEGDSVMKLTEDSVSEVKTYLERKVADAKSALTQAKISDEEALLSAEYEKKKNVTNGELAESIYNATINSLENNISSIQASINSLDSSADNYSSQLSSLKAQLAQAKSNLTTGKITAKAEYEEALYNYDNADKIYELAIADIGTATEEAQETYEEAQANQKAFNSFVDEDGTVKAAYTGAVVSIAYAEGDSVTSNSTVVEYANTEAITTTVSVAQDDIVMIETGDSVLVEYTAYENETFEGTVTAIDAAETDTSTSTVSYPVTITMTTFPEKILTGMSANVTFVTNQVEDVLYVSNKAIINEGIVSYVKVQDDQGNVTKTEVTTGFSNGVNVAVEGNIQEGDTVLIESTVSGS